MHICICLDTSFKVGREAPSRAVGCPADAVRKELDDRPDKKHDEPRGIRADRVWRNERIEKFTSDIRHNAVCGRSKDLGDAKRQEERAVRAKLTPERHTFLLPRESRLLFLLNHQTTVLRKRAYRARKKRPTSGAMNHQKKYSLGANKASMAGVKV